MCGNELKFNYLSFWRRVVLTFPLLKLTMPKAY